MHYVQAGESTIINSTILVMKQFFTAISILWISLFMMIQNVEAQRDTLRVEKRVIVSADEDTMIVITTLPEHEEEVIISADGDTIMVTRRLPRSMRNMVVRGNMPHSMHVEREVIISADGDTMIVTETSPRHHRRGRQLHTEREIVINADGDTTIVSTVTGGSRRSNIRRSHTGHQMRHRVRQRPGPRKRMRGRDMSSYGHRDSRELRRMETEARKLARQLRQADEETYSEKEAMLRVQLEKIFDYKQEMRMEELNQKRSDLEEQSRITEERQSNRDAMIKDRIRELLGHGSLYRW